MGDWVVFSDSPNIRVSESWKFLFLCFVVPGAYAGDGKCLYVLVYIGSEQSSCEELDDVEE